MSFAQFSYYMLCCRALSMRCSHKYRREEIYFRQAKDWITATLHNTHIFVTEVPHGVLLTNSCIETTTRVVWTSYRPIFSQAPER